ncbi:MAG: DUF6428 family protein [Rhizobiaceae bacterium]
MTTFANLLSDLQSQNPASPLIFATDAGAIGAGYHVTELRHSLSKGIDCGGKIETWQEARLQLLDGQGSEHMSVGKFSSIVEKSISAMPVLADAPLLIEFGHNNNALKLMTARTSESDGDSVVMRLDDAHAVCKPAVRLMGGLEDQDACCCGNDEAASTIACCSNDPTSKSNGACCG